MGTGWRQTGSVAWTLRDGPGRPPAGPHRTAFAALAVGLVTAFAGMLTTNALCPEHRTWVSALAGTAFIGAAVALVGLLRRWALAPLFAAAVCVIGVGIGLIDAAHAPERGAAIAIVFGTLALTCVVASLRVVRLWAWDRAVAASLRAPRPDDAAVDIPAPATPVASPATPAPSAPAPAAHTRQLERRVQRVGPSEG
jgi:hypothetical protein